MEAFLENTMAYMNWEEIKAAGEQKLPVLFPLGVIEEHGPHLPLAADIIWSTHICKEVKKTLAKRGRQVLIAPPYYFGVNHCTSAFPGSFSLKPETFEQVLVETFTNLQTFGFEEIFCFNYHGDPMHIEAIINSIKKVNEMFTVKVKYVMERMDLELYGMTGSEEFLHVFAPEYKPEWFEGMEPEEEGLLDIHAGAFETGILQYMCPELVNTEKAKSLVSYSLTQAMLAKWMEGGDSTVCAVPLGYAGNPKGYEAVASIAEEMIALQVQAICEGI